MFIVKWIIILVLVFLFFVCAPELLLGCGGSGFLVVVDWGNLEVRIIFIFGVLLVVVEVVSEF